MEIRMSPSSSNSAASPTMTEMRSNFMPEEMPPMNTGLSTVQIAGIGAGAGLAGLLVIALLFLFFRRRKQAKEDKSAFSKQISSPDTDTSQISSWGASRPRQPPVDKRRSFWRVSIKPEEIGIAVSERPGKRESGSSQVSMPKQPTPTMPARYADPRSSWPSLTRVNAAAPPRPPRDSVATIFDEDIEQQPNGPPRVSVGGVNFALAEPVKSSRARNTPQPLQLNQQAVPSPIFSAATSSALPLTPTYDNGNFIATPNRSIAPNSIDAALAATLPVSSMAPGGSDNVSPTPSPRRNRLQKKSSPKKPPPTAASYPTRQDSMSTEFDTDTTPGEDERRLETKASSPLAVIPQSPQSPISNLRYPSVPESAAVSPQARGNHAQPQQVVRSPSLTQFPLPNSDRQRRNTLFRNDQSFITIDSVSSEGRNSDYSIEWPVPPTNRPQDLGPLSPLSRIMNRATVETQYSIQRASEAHLSPSSQATITPGSKPGDLFFKVVMR
ncbi:uncharacterized protein HMPREF1541_02872 [Cyphellophora europaea CBS 101466]|uniref:Uncharacterized protein n=1 Tax=Cyphellophora europaea (strain CBS 101466) TaxID=1220924 RepID=W2S6P6_CYPE1|nr:uncharacterized protein HMPREF1541_02872 [Cyphellophora europaea CBS 101466]ETN43713.1 hypothetical protein HMPREF1541_02872 [Cyphellophora europaea CBS 101466]